MATPIPIPAAAPFDRLMFVPPGGELELDDAADVPVEELVDVPVVI